MVRDRWFLLLAHFDINPERAEIDVLRALTIAMIRRHVPGLQEINPESAPGRPRLMETEECRHLARLVGEMKGREPSLEDETALRRLRQQWSQSRRKPPDYPFALTRTGRIASISTLKRKLRAGRMYESFASGLRAAMAAQKT